MRYINTLIAVISIVLVASFLNAEESLFNAAGLGDVKLIKNLICNGHSVKIKNDSGDSPEDIARSNGHAAAASFLNSLKIKRYPSGSTYTGQMKDGKEHGWGVYKSYKGSTYCGDFLEGFLQGNGKWKYANGTEYNGRFKKGLFLDRKINRRDSFGDSSIFSAVRNQHVERVWLLLRKGADVNIRNINGQTPLHYAAFEGNAEIVKLLLENGALINSKDNFGLTPLHLAAYEGKLNTVSVLVRRGAGVNVKDCDGITPLHYAAYHDSVISASFLVENGAGLFARDRNGRTALYHATQLKRRNMIEFLKNKMRSFRQAN